MPLTSVAPSRRGACGSISVWMRRHSSSSRFSRSRSTTSCCRCSTSWAIWLKAPANAPNSSRERTGTRAEKSPCAMRCTPSVSVVRLRVMRRDRGTMPIRASAMTPSPSERLRTEAFWISWSDCAIGRAMPNVMFDGASRVTITQSPSCRTPERREAVTFNAVSWSFCAGLAACRAPSASIANGISPCEAWALPSTSANVRGRLS